MDENTTLPEPTKDERGNLHQKGRMGSLPKTGWEDIFLQSFKNSGIVRTALELSGISWPTLTRHLQNDADFAARYEVARRESLALLEHAAWSRAIKGVTKKRKIYYKGEEVGTEEETTYSDDLLKFLLKANDPKKYGDRVDHTHNLTILREEARKMAEAEGIDAEAAVKEAERIFYGKG